MGHSKPRPAPRPQGEQSLGELGWAQVVKAIRQLTDDDDDVATGP